MGEIADPAHRGQVPAEAGVDVLRGRDDPEAVRSDHANAVLGGGLQHPLLERQAVLAHFLEAGGDDDDGFDPHLAALKHDPRHRRRRNHDHHQVRHVSDRGQVRVAFEPLDDIRLVVDRIDLAGKAGLDHVVEDFVSDFGFLGGGADDGNRFRVKEILKTHFDPLEIFPFEKRGILPQTDTRAKFRRHKGLSKYTAVWTEAA